MLPSEQHSSGNSCFAVSPLDDIFSCHNSTCCATGPNFIVVYVIPYRPTASLNAD